MAELRTGRTDEIVQWRHYLELCKPRVVAVMLLTVVVGMFLAVPGLPTLSNVIWGVLGIGLVASAAAAVIF